MAKKTQKIADSACLPKTRNSANIFGCKLFDACPKANANGGSNSDCPKVKFVAFKLLFAEIDFCVKFIIRKNQQVN